MLKINKGNVKIKGIKENLINEMSLLIKDFINLLGLENFKRSIENSGYRITLHNLEVPKDIEKEIMEMLKNRKK